MLPNTLSCGENWKKKTLKSGEIFENEFSEQYAIFGQSMKAVL